jgi:hypothetical protein
VIVRQDRGRTLVDREYLQTTYRHLTWRTIRAHCQPVACDAAPPPRRRGRPERTRLYDAHAAAAALSDVQPLLARRKAAQQARQLDQARARRVAMG